MDRTKHLADVAFIVACTVLLAVVVGRYFFTPPDLPPIAGSAREDVVPAGSPHPVGPQGQFVAVLYLQAGCPYCQDSMPFYRRLVDAAGVDRVMFQNHGDSEAFAQYLRSNDLPASAVLNLSVPPEIRGTPTLVLVDEHGDVAHSWTGRLSEDQEVKILALMR